MPGTLETLDKRWADACRVLFKSELGPLSEYAAWLTKNNEPIIRHQSSISGKNVSYSIPYYSEGSKWISFDEIDFERAPRKLDIDDIKDIDSLASAVSETFYYAGNVVLGNSGNIGDSANITDCFYMQEAGKLTESRYIAYSTLGRLNSDCFGCNGIGESQFCVKAYETFRDKRCFELWMGQNCSDCYYSHNLNACADCMFCFNLKNAHFSIGNLALAPDRYRKLRDALVAQMADELRSKRKIDSLVEIAQKCKTEKPEIRAVKNAPAKTGRKPIDSAFSETLEIIFGRKMELGMDECSKWLMRDTHARASTPSAASGENVLMRNYAAYFALPRNRMLKFSEAERMDAALSPEGAENLSLANAHECIGKIAFFTSEYEAGTNLNIIECATVSDSMNCYRAEPAVFSKYCAYSFWPRSSTHAFGCDALLSGDFCVKCGNSVKLVRCFEMDSCRDCSDSYYCHNAENVRESMFCFNSKNRKYAVGNMEIGKEKYMPLKKSLLEQLADELESKKSIKRSVFNIG
jgi:hypothetical protein